jgi:pantothenate synthetase
MFRSKTLIKTPPQNATIHRLTEIQQATIDQLQNARSSENAQLLSQQREHARLHAKLTTAASLLRDGQNTAASQAQALIEATKNTEALLLKEMESVLASERRRASE